MSNLKEKFGKFELGKTQVKNLNGGYAFFLFLSMGFLFFSCNVTREETVSPIVNQIITVEQSSSCNITETQIANLHNATLAKYQSELFVYMNNNNITSLRQVNNDVKNYLLLEAAVSEAFALCPTIDTAKFRVDFQTIITNPININREQLLAEKSAEYVFLFELFENCANLQEADALLEKINSATLSNEDKFVLTSSVLVLKHSFEYWSGSAFNWEILGINTLQTSADLWTIAKIDATAILQSYQACGICPPLWHAAVGAYASAVAALS
jgi:hypothetical protein